ncbi:hypothetical protein SE17_02280 [Kouleothrix aurantiaca]|uniref:Uncharacterized protein n=1 Tax=Kouleothrix aurantiaca TaxID=186479 RepID=A0A0P9FN48_9CHLR|nr:hypothetical protein SE17_02280 [Kouleothrix aurantiaca]
MFETVIADIKDRLEALKEDRAACELQFRLQLAAFDGATQELETMLKWYEDKQANPDEGGSE